MTARVPDPARYEAKRIAEPENPACPFGVFDSFTQSFAAGEAYQTWSQALTAAGRINRAYWAAVGEKSP